MQSDGAKAPIIPQLKPILVLNFWVTSANKFYLFSVEVRFLLDEAVLLKWCYSASEKNFIEEL